MNLPGVWDKGDIEDFVPHHLQGEVLRILRDIKLAREASEEVQLYVFEALERRHRKAMTH